MSDWLRKQAVRHQERDEKNATDPSKILTYRHGEQTAFAEFLVDWFNSGSRSD
jgi:hypothetical protein